MNEPPYAELHCTSNFSFLQSGSHPDELVRTAHALGYAAIAITDHETLAGIVRAHAAAKETGIRLVVGAQFAPIDALPLVVWARDRGGYANLCRLLTKGHAVGAASARRAAAGDAAAATACVLSLDEIGRAHV